MWMDAVIAGSKGQPILDNLTFEFNSQSSGILNWIKERGAEFVTASSDFFKIFLKPIQNLFTVFGFGFS